MIVSDAAWRSRHEGHAPARSRPPTENAGGADFGPVVADPPERLGADHFVCFSTECRRFFFGLVINEAERNLTKLFKKAQDSA
ncbi:unnamed protein product [Nesidiocoris tenuis]|uniref:Uncharacterized protein n=1 Tax=Nesidiocoris tenuis TaxID=355587 RepID=A0A6H5GHH3_9HEMI|nr:unnamed protein product [Nesidiocoris tenuis]